MSLQQKDLEAIERVIYKNADDVAVSIARSFERVEDRIESAEMRFSDQLLEITGKIALLQKMFLDEIIDLREDIRSASDK